MGCFSTCLLVLVATVLPAFDASSSFLSTFEAYMSNSNTLCLGDCMPSTKRCVYDYNAHETECKALSIRTKKYRTINNVQCTSNCGAFDNENYQWCMVYNEAGWDFCTRLLALKGKPSYRTHNKYLMCTDECAKQGSSFNWCHTINNNWEKCDPLKKTLLFDYRTIKNTMCAGPCEIYLNNVAYCYDTDFKWRKCYLNPEYKSELNRIHHNLLRHYGVGGDYPRSGYQLCRSKRVNRNINHELLVPVNYDKSGDKNYDNNVSVKSNTKNGTIVDNATNYNPVARFRRDLNFDDQLNVEQVATAYEDNNPTVTVRHLDANIITTDTDPVISYTVLPTYSHFGNDQVNLPLAVRAIVTTHTLRNAGQRESFNAEIDRHFESMSPNHNHVNYDERGHIVGSRLGGPTETFNIFPQSWSHNRGRFSRWQYFETDLDNYLRNQPNRYAEYTAVLSYQTDSNGALNHRPTAIALRVRLYDNGVLVNFNGSPVTYQTNTLENMYFTNDPDNSCIIEGDFVENNYYP